MLLECTFSQRLSPIGQSVGWLLKSIRVGIGTEPPILGIRVHRSVVKVSTWCWSGKRGVSQCDGGGEDLHDIVLGGEFAIICRDEW